MLKNCAGRATPELPKCGRRGDLVDRSARTHFGPNPTQPKQIKKSMPYTPPAPGRAFFSVAHDGRSGTRIGTRFDRIPLRWLEAAARLPGKSLHTGVALWYVAGLTRSASVRLCNVASLRFGLDRNAKYRALVWLESAGLIAVKRKRGRAPIVTILEVGPAP